MKMILRAKYTVGDRIELFYDGKIRPGTIVGAFLDTYRDQDCVHYDLSLDYDPTEHCTAWENEIKGLVNRGKSAK